MCWRLTGSPAAKGGSATPGRLLQPGSKVTLEWATPSCEGRGLVCLALLVPGGHKRSPIRGQEAAVKTSPNLGPIPLPGHSISVTVTGQQAKYCSVHRGGMVLAGLPALEPEAVLNLERLLTLYLH